MSFKSGLILMLLCMLNPNVHAEDLSASEDIVYQVQQGDNLSKLASDLLDTPTRWNEVARYNQLRDSNLIWPEQKLRIKLAWLKNFPAEARIESLVGRVMLNGLPAKVGDPVTTGAAIKTPAGGSVRLSLPDGSTMNVLEKSLISARQLERKERGNFFNTLFRMVTGRIEVLKQKYPMGQAPLRIQSMHATLGVRGTHFRMGQEENNTLAEIEEGTVDFGAEHAGEPLELTGGYGSVADGINPPQAIPLLPRPAFPSFDADFPLQSIAFTMPDMEGATGYRGEVAMDEDFMQLVAPVSAEGNVIKITGLSEGRYWLRLRAVDEHGLQGLEAKVAFGVMLEPLRDLPTVVVTPPQVGNDKQTTVSWRGDSDMKYELHVASSEDFMFLWLSYIAQGTQMNIPQPLPMPGKYFIRVRAIDGKRAGEWSNTVTWNVR